VLHILNRAPLQEYSHFFRNTDVAGMTQEAEKPVLFIRATISNKVKVLIYLNQTDDPFSIKGYIRRETPSIPGFFNLHA